MPEPKPRIPLKTMVYAALSIALVFVVTRLLSFPGPVPPGYINLGDALIILSAALFGPGVGFAAGAIGFVWGKFLHVRMVDAFAVGGAAGLPPAL